MIVLRYFFMYCIYHLWVLLSHNFPVYKLVHLPSNYQHNNMYYFVLVLEIIIIIVLCSISTMNFKTRKKFLNGIFFLEFELKYVCKVPFMCKVNLMLFRWAMKLDSKF